MSTKNTEKVEKICRFLPTGFGVLDIMLGENKRDLDGNLTDIFRGFDVTGKQYAIAAQQGAGKSTFIADAASFPFHIGMEECVHKIIIIDTDNASWNPHRLRKLTNLSLETIEKKFKVYQEQDIVTITSILKKESEEYNKMKYKPVKFFDNYMGMERTMMPCVMVVTDTVTSLSSDVYEKDMLAKQQSLTTFLDVSNLSNNVGSLFSGNNAFIWMAHLKENKPKLGATVAEKEFKSAPGQWKSHIPLRIKQKLSSFLWFTKTQDMSNQESPSHPIQIYGMQDLSTKSLFVTNAISVKSRTGTEGRTVCKLMFIDGKFDREMSLLITCLNCGVFKEGSGMHPSVGAGMPSIFKDKPGCEAEYKAQGMRKKKIITINGFDRPTNIIELRLLLNYTGPNQEIHAIVDDLKYAIQSELEEVLSYELESNNVTADDVQTNQAKIRALVGFMRGTRRTKKTMTKSELDEITPEKKLDYLGEGGEN